MPLKVMLEHVTLVLCQPRDVVNIGGVVRAMKNMGLRHLRLVAPVAFAPVDVLGIAHRSEDVLAAMRVYDRLDDALRGMHYVVGTTARPRGLRPAHYDPRILAPALLEQAAHGQVALVFGPEDNGLDNAALDRCNAVVTLPSDPAYPSLNLAQAALLLMYELRLAVLQGPPPSPPARPTASTDELEALFRASERSLRAIEFFKSGNANHVMRVLRHVLYRAALDRQEAALLTAMAREVVAFLERRGLRG